MQLVCSSSFFYITTSQFAWKQLCDQCMCLKPNGVPKNRIVVQQQEPNIGFFLCSKWGGVTQAISSWWLSDLTQHYNCPLFLFAIILYLTSTLTTTFYSNPNPSHEADLQTWRWSNLQSQCWECKEAVSQCIESCFSHSLVILTMWNDHMSKIANERWCLLALHWMITYS